MNTSSDSTGLLAPWEGDDMLTPAKEAALAASRGELVTIPRPPVNAVQRPQRKSQAEQTTECPPEDLPEIGAFVRSLRGLNSIAIFKDLSAAGLMSRRAGRYQQRPRRTGDVEWFRSINIGPGHSVFVTLAGQDLLRQLKEDGKLTKALTKVALTPRQKRARRYAREATKKRNAERKSALAKRQPEVLAKLEQTIEACIARREKRTAIWREAGRAGASKPADSQQASKD
jgi:hypothetical protein